MLTQGKLFFKFSKASIFKDSEEKQVFNILAASNFAIISDSEDIDDLYGVSYCRNYDY